MNTQSGSSKLKIRIVMAQLNMLVGGVFANVNKVIEKAIEARDQLHADAVVFPELALTGYPPEDLLLRPGLYKRVLRALEILKRKVNGIDIIVGYPRQATGGVYNAASLIRNGEIVATYHKQHLPNYSVFDEKRYFTPGSEICLVDIKGIPVGLTICEDIWMPSPANACADAGAKLLINLNASPYHIDKSQERENVVKQRINEIGIPVLYANLVGGQDELVFDGGSFVMDATTRITQRTPAFVENLYEADFEFDGQNVTPVQGICHPHMTREESVYHALVLGVRDYVKKNGFRGVVIGLSGGIDSALTLAVAVDAIGKDRVEAVAMPSRYTASMSLEDAEIEAKALGVEFQIIAIEPVFIAFLESLKDEFAGTAVDTTEENLQARCRGVLLMAISNKKRKIVLTTGNKSEMAVGYATLYGDMAGGFDVLKDVPKTMVYRLAEYRNSITSVIPQRVIDRPPTAELAQDQKDQDVLPPYPVLDDILERYIERDEGLEDIVAAGHEESIVRKVLAFVDRNEYKRRQAPPGVRITRRAFGRDRRYPITSGFNKEEGEIS